MGHHTLLPTVHLEGFEAQDVALHLHKRHVTRQFADAVQPTAVHVAVGIVLQQVTDGVDAEFFAEHLPSVRSYAWQVLDVLTQTIHYYDLRIASAITRS